MSIDLNNETVGTLSEIAGKLPRVGGKRIHCSTLWRWARNGLRGVRLEHVRFGGRIMTSVEAVDRFTRRLTEDDGLQASSHTGPRPRSADQRAKDIAMAEAELAAEGI